MPNVQTDFFNEVRERMDVFLSKIRDDIKAELVAQNHVLTGTLLNSIDFEIQQKPNLIEGLMMMQDYGQAIDQGIKASNVPYSANTGRGGTSKYIQGLITFFRLKGLDEDEAKSAAFATARTATIEGHPTNGSFVHSTNGRRTGFFTDTLENLNGEIDAFYEEMGENVVLTVWNNILTRFTNEVEPIILRA